MGDMSTEEERAQWSKAGGPSLIELVEKMLELDTAARTKALELLGERDLLGAVDGAAEWLDGRGKREDRDELLKLMKPFRTWPPERREELRDVGLEAIRADRRVTIDHRYGDEPDEWVIWHDGYGHIFVRCPRDNSCKGPHSTDG